MVRASSVLSVGLCICSIVACGKRSDNSSTGKGDKFYNMVMQTLHHLESTDPVREAQAAVAKKDFRFLGMPNVGVPGVTTEELNTYVHHYGYQVIRCADDGVRYKEQLKILSLAPDYAKKYNKELLRHLKPLPPEDSSANDKKPVEMWPVMAQDTVPRSGAPKEEGRK